MMSEELLAKLEEFYHFFLFEPNFQELDRVDGMKFIIHPNENCGHNKGHVHIESGGAEIEIDLQSFEVMNMSGKITKHKIKAAQKFVEENQDMFIKHWNEFTNGIKILA